ncbi:MAG: ABC transporter permease [Actinobacteria bacterium]|nr:ABC transporter permease [Actinomycetota bacterium]
MSALPLPPVAAFRGRGGRAVRSLAEDKLLLASGAVCVAIVALALLGPLLASGSPSRTSILEANLGSSSQHWLGTDALGRDIFTRLLYGARLSLAGPALIIAVSTVLGTGAAITAVWVGGRVERVLNRVLDVLFAFPALLFAILVVAILGTGLVAPVIALSIAYTPYMARVVRSVARRERSLPYIDACQLAGLSSWRICSRHILPNVFGVVRAQASIAFGAALIDLAAISFLGLGVSPPAAEWGLMVANGSTALLNGYPQECLAAGACIVVTVVAFNLLGERLAVRSEGRR